MKYIKEQLLLKYLKLKKYLFSVTINTYGGCNGDSTLEKRVQALESMILQQSQLMYNLESESNALNGPELRGTNVTCNTTVLKLLAF